MKSGVLLITLALLLNFNQACPASKRIVPTGPPGPPGATGAPGSPETLGTPGTPGPETPGPETPVTGTPVPGTTEKTTETTIKPKDPFLKPEGAIVEIVTKTIQAMEEKERLDLRICGGDSCPVSKSDIFSGIQIHTYSSLSNKRVGFNTLEFSLGCFFHLICT